MTTPVLAYSSAVYGQLGASRKPCILATEKRNEAQRLMMRVVLEIKLLGARTSVHAGKLGTMIVLVSRSVPHTCGTIG